MPLLDELEKRSLDIGVRARRMEHRAESIKKIRLSRHESGIQQREKELRIVDFKIGELVDLTDLVTNDDTEIPQWVQEPAQEAFARPPDAPTE